jgi:iron complex transport system substrate-binding protein
MAGVGPGQWRALGARDEKERPVRIVSLLPSATESLCLVGGRRMLVGRSHECDWPAGLGDVPILTSSWQGSPPPNSSGPNGGATLAPGTAPGEIDRQVKERLASGGSLYRLDTELLASLKPDVILTQDLCEVCSIDLNTVRAAVRGLSPAPRIVSLNPSTVEDVFDDVLTVGAAAGLHTRAREEVVRLRERLFRAQEFVNPYVDGPVVGFLEWTDPLFVAGHWNVQLIERAGGRHPLNPTVAREGAGTASGMQQGERAAGKSVAVPERVFAAMKPEFIVIAPCGVGLDGAVEMARELAKKEWWGALPAVKKGRVAVVDGNQMFNRPGPRLVEAFEWLVGWMNGREELMPEQFPWRPLD